MTHLHKLIEGSVARIEDKYTLIINRGAEHGVTEGMEFAVMADEGDQIIDPETGDVIGELPADKLRVRVCDVHEKWSRAETFVHYQPRPVDLPLSRGVGGLQPSVRFPDIPGLKADYLTKHLAASGVFESISQKLSETVRNEMANPRPVRQQIDNPERQPPKKQPPIRREVTVNIGDKVREIVEPSRV